MTLSDYLDLFPGSSREKPRFMALAETVLRQAVDLQAAVASLQGAFSFAEAEGKQLDLLAESIGLGREDTTAGTGCPDAEFRKFLTAKLALWGWDGTNEGVPAVLEAGLPGNTETDNQDGTVTITPAGVLPADKQVLFPTPAGVKVG